MFKSHLASALHPTEPTLSKANLYHHFLEDGEGFPCVLVLPGGGYAGVSHQEGPPVAGWLNSLGISATVLQYSVGEDLYPSPQQQGLYALRWLKKNAADLIIDPQRIGVIGFSASGHLCATLSQGFDRPEWLLDPDGDLEGVSARPDLALLSYPVISSGPFAHRGSFNHLMGQNPEAQSALSMEHQVHENSCPSIIWHTADDGAVPVENAYLYAMGLSQKKIPHELHVFPHGLHGIGLASLGDRFNASAEQWKGLAANWMRTLGF